MSNTKKKIAAGFLSYYPLKQGLKLTELIILSNNPNHFYPTIH